MPTKPPANRCDFNPVEAAFRDQWLEHIRAVPTVNSGRNALELLLPDAPSDRDYLVAATVIQWLGSNGGQAFYKDAMARTAYAPAPTQVKALRDKMGVSMRFCLNALTEARGDEQVAITILKRKGQC